MGVHGLTTYLRENKTSCSNGLLFSTEYDEITTFVIDGWSFLYVVSELSGLPWVYGGEGDKFSAVIESVVEAWLSVGLQLHFVFDGPFPESKFPTVISRITENNVKRSLLFFRTSSTSRSSPRFLNEISVLPPSDHLVCIQTLQNIVQSLPQNSSQPCSVQIHFADEEGDPYAVELAARLGGYVVGQDSDYVILNAEGYKGYIPMSEMVWTSLSSENEPEDELQDDDGFQTVKSKFKKKALAMQKSQLGSGIIPPSEIEGLQLSVLVYSPNTLAAHLEIPPSLLPLLASLVGNDFTGSKESSSVTTAQETNLQWLFFKHHLTLTQRIARVAKTLHNILAAALSSNAKGKTKVQVNSVMQLIEKAVTSLIIRSPDSLGSKEKDRIVERVVDATLQYAIPRFDGDADVEGLGTSSVCTLHSEEDCPLMRYMLRPPPASLPPKESEQAHQLQRQICNLYVVAYRLGHLDCRLFDVMNTGTFWCRPFLENPDVEAAGKTFGRPIHEICYSLLEDGLGLPERPDDENDDGSEATEQESDEDELVDVAEESDDEDQDHLAPLRSALHRLDSSDEEEDFVDVAASVSSSRSKSAHPNFVVEFVRRGVRFGHDEVEVPPLSSILTKLELYYPDDIPMQLRSEDDRFTFFLRCLGSDTATIRSLPSTQLLVALTLRWVASRLHSRADSKERIKEQWSKQEGRAFLAAFSFGARSTAIVDSATVPLTDRNVQLVAQTSITLAAIHRLAQLLLLTDRVPSPVCRFSGKTFHAYLTNSATIPTNAVPALLWEASIEGLAEAFMEPLGKKKKKAQKDGQGVANGHSTNTRKPVGSMGGKFGLLASLNP